ncbi:MAG TPA: alpha-amylase family glycosyl hydrolase [Candidatus Saccharimonadales bacterium]|nr:alpha-amylase family glycosyl hydrolase [Candidatus Saccharimonadales bacterium]
MAMNAERLSSADSWDGRGIYQIYPRTFDEVHNDDDDYSGVGNLRGIIEKRDYLYDLGVGGIWISPFYPSPMVDGGYDISDYTDIDPELGNMRDFLELLEAYHERDIKVMIDLVPNHTSDQHPWFQESRTSLDSNKADWYIWHDPAPNGGPPNNWSSVFSIPNLRARQNGTLIVPDGENTPPVSAWQYDEQRGQYYLRDFAAEQPNLNWQNPAVRAAMKDVMRFWIDLGVDGFRVDVANHLGKNPDFTDEKPNPNYREGVDNPHDQYEFYNSLNHPDTLYPYLEELTSVCRENPERDLRMILECWMPEDDLVTVNRVAPDIASAFNFTRLTAPWNGRTHQELLDTYHANLPDGAIPNQVRSNHDVPRVATRLGAAARSAAVLDLTLPGTIFIYNGEEGGFTDTDVPPERRHDTELGERDGVRTPMLWDSSENAGFSRASPDALWLPIDPEYETKNLALQQADPRSSFSLYRSLLHLRRGSPSLRYGNYQGIINSHPDIVSFARRHEREQTMTLVNFAEQPTTFTVHKTEQNMGRVTLSSINPELNRMIILDEPITLQPLEAVVVTQA